ncbi:ATP-binding cassette domain-containing protein [Lachnospiraceae bacterium 29-84]
MAISIQIKKEWEGFGLNVCFQGEAKRIGILGASGSGKSMALKSIAGIETPEAGMIEVDKRLCFDSAKGVNIRPQERDIGYLFQNYALFPSMTVAQNIAAGLKGRKAEKRARVEEMIERFQLRGLSGRRPHELSGGQQQRVALARMMACQPKAILLDEPFSALDVYLRDSLQRELLELLQDFPGTAILVSHSRDEIYRFSEELLILDRGKSLVYGKTKEIFANPMYREAAKLTGCKNFSAIQRIDGHTIEAVDWGIQIHTERLVPAHASCIGYRAHDFVPIWNQGGARTGPPANAFRVQVAERAELPFETNYYLHPQNARKEAGLICWFVQRNLTPQICERGLPDYLGIQEQKIMYLED